MEKRNTFGFDLIKILTTFELNVSSECEHLNDWVSATYELDIFDQKVVDDVFLDIEESGEYMNEEELKARMVGLMFYAAKIDVAGKIRVFYERPLAAEVKGHYLAVITDCMVASPLKSNPIKPYFFLQEAPSRPSPKGKENFYKVKKKIPKRKCFPQCLSHKL